MRNIVESLVASWTHTQRHQCHGVEVHTVTGKPMVDIAMQDACLGFVIFPNRRQKATVDRSKQTFRLETPLSPSLRPPVPLPAISGRHPPATLTVLNPCHAGCICCSLLAVHSLAGPQDGSSPRSLVDATAFPSPGS